MLGLQARDAVRAGMAVSSPSSSLGRQINNRLTWPSRIRGRSRKSTAPGRPLPRDTHELTRRRRGSAACFPRDNGIMALVCLRTSRIGRHSCPAPVLARYPLPRRFVERSPPESANALQWSMSSPLRGAAKNEERSKCAQVCRAVQSETSSGKPWGKWSVLKRSSSESEDPASPRLANPSFRQSETSRLGPFSHLTSFEAAQRAVRIKFACHAALRQPFL